MATRDKLEDSGGSAASTGLSESGARGAMVPPDLDKLYKHISNKVWANYGHHITNGPLDF